MSVIDELKQLEEKRTALLSKAKDEALAQAEAAVETLNQLGFHYRLVEGTTVSRATPRAPREPGTRRSGIREDVLRVLTEHPDGINRASILELMDAKGDKKAEQSISNALANMKKKGDVTLEDGLYRIPA